ncbi:MAG: glycine cleavage system aminomethyltransferase GcvT [Bdellovibrionales bacterium]
MFNPRQTPLTAEHEKLGAKMVDFAGWYMPVEYKGLRQEHMNTRENVGLFDVSHMGEIRVKGPKSLETLQWLTSNDVAKVQKGQAQYGLLTNDKGGIVDDLIIYCVEYGQDYLVCVNASNTEKDFKWMKAHNRGAEISDESSLWGQIAVQGPKALKLIAKVFSQAAADAPGFHFTWESFQGARCMIARTGYTGEEGVEVFVPAEKTVALWQEMLKQGEAFGAQPVGLGARDTLRTEMKYSLYGHEIDDESNPYEAGLGWVVKPDQKDFVGKEPMLKYKAAGLKRKLIGLIMTERGIPRAGYALFSFDNKEIGKVTSGTVSPSLNDNIGIAYVDVAFAEVGTLLNVDIRGRKVQARVVKTPFIDVNRSKT